MGAVWNVLSCVWLLMLSEVSSGERHCAYSYRPPNSHLPEDPSSQAYYTYPNEVLSPDNRTVQCPHDDDHCFSFWGTEIVSSRNVSYLIQGCWDQKQLCNRGSECVATTHRDSLSLLQKISNDSHICCCSGDMCNANMTNNATFIPFMEPASEPQGAGFAPFQSNYKQLTVIIALSSVLAAALIILVLYLVYRKVYILSETKLSTIPEASDMYLVKSPSTPSLQLDQLEFSTLINRGRFGEVWRGTLNEVDVAIKVFTPSQRQYYINERDVYLLPHMDHASLLPFYGADERINDDGQTQYVLVMGLVEAGNLSCYLKNNMLTWSVMCRMAHSVTSGLAYLHSELELRGKFKSAVAHRDLNSRNILVNDDLSCSLCDFGFAMKIKCANFLCHNGPEESVEQASLTDVGTLRYMAPEVLEGAVNLRDCESSLKQIDVYALGLVIWEIASRCQELYQGLPVPEYKLPFETEIGLHPSFEEMQMLVTKNKARPLFPDVWKDTNQTMRALKETIEDCWDQDGEARLTALCVEERILDMKALWENRHKGMTPTVMMSGLGILEEKTEVQHNLTQSSHHPAPFSENAVPHNPRDGNINLGIDFSQMSEPVNELASNASRRSQRVSYTDNSVSGTSTIETTLSPSEFDPVVQVPTKANCNVLYAQTSKVLQPHQGQNPTVERNTHKRSDEDVTVLGNTLVSSKSVASSGSATGSSVTNARSRWGIPNATATVSDELLGAISDNLESSLVQNDLLNQSRRLSHQPPVPAPQLSIPYLQNEVHPTSTSEPMIVRPKQPNIPGNGSALHSNLNQSNAHPTAKQNWFGKFLKGRGEKRENRDNRCQRPLLGSDLAERDISTSKLQFPFFSKFTGSSSSSASAGSSACSSTASSASSGPECITVHVPTEVRILNGVPVVRPSSLPLSGACGGGTPSDEHSNVINPVPNGVVPKSCAIPQITNKPDNTVKAAASHITTGNPASGKTLGNSERNLSGDPRHTSVVNVKPRIKSKSNLDLSPGHSSQEQGSNIQLNELESNGRARRPKSLSISSTHRSSSTSSNVEISVDDSSVVLDDPAFL